MQQRRIVADGSDRIFEPCVVEGRKALRIVPPPTSEGLREARSFAAICAHLDRCGIPVPGLLEFDERQGHLLVTLFEGRLLQDVAVEFMAASDFASLKRLYGEVLGLLLALQARATDGFDPAWCWQGERYDQGLCLDREAGYFLDAFVQGWLGLNVGEAVERQFDSEVRALCRQLCLAEEFCLMHRDFQSRNILVAEQGDGGLCLVDFQGARLGPPEYDLASLLHDPYVDLPWGFRLEMFDKYLEMAAETTGPPRLRHDRFWMASAMRLQQALGAYGYLSGVKGKPFFQAYMVPALLSLERVLEVLEEMGWAVQAIVGICRKAIEALRERAPAERSRQ